MSTSEEKPEVGWRGQLITWESTRARCRRGPEKRLTSLRLGPSFVGHFTKFENTDVASEVEVLYSIKQTGGLR